jgi:uncharacterized protein (DUF1697 family)
MGDRRQHNRLSSIVYVKSWNNVTMWLNRSGGFPMPRYIAFLRAINVGGHNVKMTQLRALFEELEFANVETFIASGNVIFDAPDANVRQIEQQIEHHLHSALGYAVATFIRSTVELAAVVAYQPFSPAELVAEGSSLYVSFLRSAPSDAAAQKLQALRTEIDDFHVHEREFYWLRRSRISDASFPAGLFEKILGLPATMRNVTTVRKLAAKYPAT